MGAQGNRPPDNIPEWFKTLDEREAKEVQFCRLYAREFGHGATNHNIMKIVAKLSDLLDQTEKKAE